MHTYEEGTFLCCLLLGHSQSQNNEPAFCGSAWFVTHGGKYIYSRGPSHRAALVRADSEESCPTRDYSSAVPFTQLWELLHSCFHNVFLWLKETWAAIAEIIKNHEFLQFKKNLVFHSLHNVLFGGKKSIYILWNSYVSVLDWVIILADKKPLSEQSHTLNSLPIPRPCTNSIRTEHMGPPKKAACHLM